MLKEFATYIENNVVGMTIGTTLHAGYFPADALESSNAIIDTGGATDLDLLDYVEKTFQVLSRSKDFHTARDSAFSIYSFLHGKKAIVLPVVDGGTEYLINILGGASTPQSLPQDERGLFYFSTNYVLRMQDN